MDVDFQEKMDVIHRTYLCRMLKMKELPEALLERYVQVKRMVDRIDGHLTPGDLAMIIVSAGVEELTCQAEGKAEEVAEATIDRQGAGDGGDVNGATKPVGSLDEADDKEVEETLEHPTASPAIKANFWSLGMPVNVLAEDELKQGKIVGLLPPEPDSGKAVQLTVELEGGETVTVDGTEVEAC